VFNWLGVQMISVSWGAYTLKAYANVRYLSADGPQEVDGLDWVSRKPWDAALLFRRDGDCRF